MSAAEPHRVPDTLAERVQACTQCHGKEGRATPDGYFPRIAGKPAGYLYQQLVAFRDGRRHNAAMNHLVGQLSDAYLREIAGHFASLDLPYPPPAPVEATPAVLARGATLVRRGDAARDLPACTSCHGALMTGVQPAVPGLLGLPRDYLNAQLGAWQTGQRRAVAPDCMAQVAQRMNPDDVQAVAAWLAARPVPVRAHAAPRAALKKLPMDCGSLQTEAPR
ncbi:MAG: c-type cytochrome [Burkholderiales bacterium]